MSPASRPAVSVVPMPSRAGSTAMAARMRWLAVLHHGAQRVGGLVGDGRRGQLVQDPDDDLARHLAGGQPAHAVGHRHQAVTGEGGVLVVGPDQADVVEDGRAEDQRHGVKLAKKTLRSSLRTTA